MSGWQLTTGSVWFASCGNVVEASVVLIRLAQLNTAVWAMLIVLFDCSGYGLDSLFDIGEGSVEIVLSLKLSVDAFSHGVIVGRTALSHRDSYLVLA